MLPDVVPLVVPIVPDVVPMVPEVEPAVVPVVVPPVVPAVVWANAALLKPKVNKVARKILEAFMVIRIENVERKELRLRQLDGAAESMYG